MRDVICGRCGSLVGTREHDGTSIALIVETCGDCERGEIPVYCDGCGVGVGVAPRSLMCRGTCYDCRLREERAREAALDDAADDAANDAADAMELWSWSWEWRAQIVRAAREAAGPEVCEAADLQPNPLKNLLIFHAANPTEVVVEPLAPRRTGKRFPSEVSLAAHSQDMGE